MASTTTQCFLHHHALTTSTRPSPSISQLQLQVVINTTKPYQLVCKAQKQAIQEGDGSSIVSRRLALTVLIGAAAVGSRVSPADAAYGEAGIVYCFLSFS